MFTCSTRTRPAKATGAICRCPFRNGVSPPPAKAIEISEPEAATHSLFLRLRAGWDEPIHPTPVRQTLICLRGEVEVTASDGEKRRIGPGDVWRMEDRHGKGHHTRVTSAEDFDCVIVQYD